MTNSGGPGVAATDALIGGQSRLATLSGETLQKLDAILPPTWSRGNLVDSIGDAPTERYVQSLYILLEEPQADAILFVHAPTAMVSSVEVAAVAPFVKKYVGQKKPAQSGQITLNSLFRNLR